MAVSLTTKHNASQFGESLGAFTNLFHEELNASLDRVGIAGARAQAKALDNAKTQWGEARMAGYAGLSKFTPYGKSAGRNDTGNMINSISSVIRKTPDGVMLESGWINIDAHERSYFTAQEQGFNNYGRFRGTGSGGKPLFKRAKTAVETPGAHSLEANSEVIKRLLPSYISGAWNRAVKRFGSSPGGINSYKEARSAYLNRERDVIF